MRLCDLERDDSPGQSAPFGLAEIARTWIGVKFRPQGRTRSGVDCVGLVLCVAWEAGFSMADRRGYSQRWNEIGDVEQEMAARGFAAIKPSEAFPGDILVGLPASGRIHFAVRSPSGVIEADLRCGRVIERPQRSDDRWHSAWRLLNKER